MLGYFAAVDLEYDAQTNEVIAPTFRHDIFRTADLAEEVARFYGYDKIPSTLPSGEATTGKLPFKLRVEAIARQVAQYCGFSQGMCYSFESPKVFDKLLLDSDDPARNAIVISNPLGEDFSIMRTISLNGMLTSLSTNYNRRNTNVRLYEMGNIYIADKLPLESLPDERMQFTLGAYGDIDFFGMKGVIEEFFEAIGICGKIEYDPKAGKNFLHPGRQALISYNGSVLGYLGEVHPEVADNYELGTKTYIAVIDMPNVLPFASFDRKYVGLAKYPAVSRDISMVVPKEIMVGQIEAMITQRGGKILESLSLFDIYEGSQIKDGYKSVAYNITFRAKDRTLNEDDINGAMKKILNQVHIKAFVLVLFVCFNLTASAQNENAQNDWKFSHPILVESQAPTSPQTGMLNNGEMPEFQGGSIELKKYLAKEVHETLLRRGDNVFGKVIVSFEVGKKGNLSNYKIVKSTNPSLNEDALNIVKSMPKWKPAKKNGKNVKSKISIIVNFE